ncbi:diguanylate cyclase [Glycomyces sp. NPDC021274]|uniref:diguanylate cyclase domain-containing protein n=1 Tax=Glycomyces sp. NPDC021274 TaxID=3155120 RepID=UPI0033E6683B
MNPEILFGFTAGIATAALAGGMTASVTLRRVLSRDRTDEHETHGIDALTGLYNREGFIASARALQANPEPAQGHMLCVLAYNGIERIERAYGALAAEHIIASIGADLTEYAVNGLACRFEYSFLAVIATIEDAETLAEYMQVAACERAATFEGALRTGPERYVFPVFGPTAADAAGIYGPAIHLELGIATTAYDAPFDLGGMLDALALEASDRALQATS